MNISSSSIRSEDRKEDKPPHSRIFVVCSKQLQEEDLKVPFGQFGIIEDIYMPKCRSSGESKGVAYIKYAKTSSAAAAIEAMHMKVIGNESKPVKVMVAVNKNETSNNPSEERYKRLFIRIPKQATESEIEEHFSKFPKFDSVQIQRDKVSGENKGFAYVQYHTFYGAAKAFEDCDQKYRPIFATPKDELKRNRNSFEPLHLDNISNNSIHSDSYYADSYRSHNNDFNMPNNINSLIKTKPQGFNTLTAMCRPRVAQKYIERLFDIIPGMVQFQFTVDSYNAVSKCVITYKEEVAAAHALETLNNYEFPSGEIITIKPNTNPLCKAADDLKNIVSNFKTSVDGGGAGLIQLAEAIAEASNLIKAATTAKNDQKHWLQELSHCNVGIPPIKTMANNNSRVAQRCFIVCKPHPPPKAALVDVFCRFGDLIDVSTFPNKTFGFAKYASIKSAQEAIRTLNGAIVCGVKLKVMEADERPIREDEGRLDSDEQRKRTKYNEESGDPNIYSF